MLTQDVDELKRMPSPPKTLPDASSAKFMAHLGLDIRRDDHAQLYRRMKADAILAHERICSDRSNLLPYLQKDASIRSPFTVTQITEEAIRSETLRIHAEAPDAIRDIYDNAMAIDQGVVGSWAARWMLWHVFLRGGYAESPVEEDGTRQNWTLNSPSLHQVVEAGRQSRSNEPRKKTGSLSQAEVENRSYWDPVRHSG